MKEGAENIARRMKIKSRHVEGKGGDGARYLNPFLVNNIYLHTIETHIDGKSFERSFQWYVGDKKWPPGSHVRPSQSWDPKNSKLQS